ncbi:hypothetical protein R1T16_13580 [Flavobacterium sp. DG1-102-2]|uniref:hypothetical protein n=1 Tax=Flavobacterium sp. DG1-102-2 TaxID=3081663 RepID=UPI00294A4B91|nr:hypothetical protein [Flavobacterium sp. DG1-102-2]MDV6169461.1 hypothetical protein [Flavobacterium sp. DG1-102-2]
MDAGTIEQWITEIENDAAYRKDKRIEDLINLWKFASIYNSDAEITKDGQMAAGHEDAFKVDFMDICLKEAPKSDTFENVCGEIAPALNLMADYYILLNEQQNNLTPQSLTNLHREMLDAIQGKLVLYKHVKQITKVAASSAGIHTNLKVKDCGREHISALLKQKKYTRSSGKWMVLVLDRLVSQCDAFYLDDTIFRLPFKTGYQKLFLFDFYKGEIIELPVAR